MFAVRGGASFAATVNDRRLQPAQLEPESLSRIVRWSRKTTCNVVPAPPVVSNTNAGWEEPISVDSGSGNDLCIEVEDKEFLAAVMGQSLCLHWDITNPRCIS